MAEALKKKLIRIWTPPGIFSFPHFAAPDVGREYSNGKYRTDFFMKKETFKKEGQKLQEVVLQVGRDTFGSEYSFKPSCKFKNPFKDSDKNEKVLEQFKGCIVIKPNGAMDKNTKKPVQPRIIGPRKGVDGRFPLLTVDEIAAIKGGDWGCLYVAVIPYFQQGGGITLGLNAVQFWKTGEAIGGGNSAFLESAEELENVVESPTSESVADSDDDSIV